MRVDDLMRAAEDERLRETETDFWRSQPGVLDDIVQAREDQAAGRTWSAAAVRSRYGLDDD